MFIRIIRPAAVSGLTAAMALAGCAHAPPPAAPSNAAAPAKGAPVRKAKFSGDTMMSILLDDPASRAVLARHIPKVVGSNQIALARGLTLKQLAGFAQAGISPKVLAAIEADLAKLN